MNWTLLHRYLTGESTDKEKKQVKSWIESDQRNKEFMDSLIKIWEVEPGDEIEVDARAAWVSFKHRLSDEKREVSDAKSTNIYRLNEIRSPRYAPAKESNGYRRTIAISLTAAAVLAVALLFYQLSPLVGARFADTSDESPKAQEVNTERGQRTTLKLFDGTRVQLNAESSIRIPPGFGDSSRVVHLQGEAYFNVTHNPEMPFIVYSGSSLTRVLGTKFDVKAYPEDNHVQVVVEEGKVAFSVSPSTNTDTDTEIEERQITEGQIGLLNEDGRTTVSKTTEIQQYLGWKDGRLIFNSTAFEDAIPQLQRWFDIRIVVADSSAKSKHLTASFKDEPMTEVMNIISLSLDLHYEREGRTFTFYSN